MAARFWPAAARRAARSCPLKVGLATAPKLSVLRKRAEFLSVASSGRKWVAPSFILQIGPAHEAGDFVRYGLTASRKVGNAVARNRARRRLRALAEEILPNALLVHDYVLIARDVECEATFDVMRADMIKGMKRLKVWREAEKP